MTGEQTEDFETLGRRILNLWRQGNRDEAVAIASRANYAARNALGHNHAMYAAGLSSLARMYLDLGRVDEAEAELLEAANIAATASGLFTSAYGESLSRLIIVCQASGRDFDANNLANAMRLVLNATLEGGPTEAQLKNLGNLNRALQTKRRHLQNELGRRAEKLHDYEEAERSYRRATENVAEDQKSAEYAMALDNLAGLLCIKGDWAEAERFGTEALSLFKARLGPGEVDTLICMNGLAIIMERQGKTDAAIRLYETVIRTCRQAGGTSPDEPVKAILKTLLSGLAKTYIAKGHNADSRTMQLDVWQHYQEVYELLRDNRHSVEFAMLVANVAQVHYGIRALGSAYGLMEASSKLLSALGSHDAYLHTNYLNAGTLAISLGMFEEAEVKLQKALQWHIEHFGQLHLETAKCIAEMVRLSALQGNRPAFVAFVRRLKAIDDHLLQAVLLNAQERDALLFAEDVWRRTEICIAGSVTLNLDDSEGLITVYDLVLARKGIVLNAMIARQRASHKVGATGILEFAENNAEHLLSCLKSGQVLLDFVRVDYSVLGSPRSEHAEPRDWRSGLDEVDDQVLFRTFDYAGVPFSSDSTLPTYYCFVSSGIGRLSLVDAGSATTVEDLTANYVRQLREEITAPAANVFSLAKPTGQALRRLILDSTSARAPMPRYLFCRTGISHRPLSIALRPTMVSFS